MPETFDKLTELISEWKECNKSCDKNCTSCRLGVTVFEVAEAKYDICDILNKIHFELNRSNYP